MTSHSLKRTWPINSESRCHEVTTVSTQWKYEASVCVTSRSLAAVNQWWRDNIDLDSTEDTFTQGLSASGTGRTTHYWCNTLLQKWQLAKIKQLADARPNDVRVVIWHNKYGSKNDVDDQLSGRTHVTITRTRQASDQVLARLGMTLDNP